jgi:alkanesulfonate monooxygenase SsuD/methylene tetrahydromethanopterin reductase-like flavin-dependent oxidoreductase (luciferase family)
VRVSIRYGISVPNFADYADPRVVAALAREAEAAGWDGFFVWDHMLFMPGFREPVADPWILLAAIATATERVRLGPLITPVARRRPWKLARETVTLDHLSNGRLIFGAGLGHPPDAEFAFFGEEGDAQVRAQKLDEGLDILAGLWSGEPFRYGGEQFQIEEVTFLPTPLQAPRIPVWVAAYWPRKAPFRRAARWDGVVPGSVGTGWNDLMPLADVRAALACIREQRAGDMPFDLVLRGISTGTDRERDRATIAPYAEAGMTWWIEHLHGYRGPFDAMRARIRLGPPG